MSDEGTPALRLRRWSRRVLLGLCLLAGIFASVPLLRMLPYLQDDLTLDRIVVAVALDWRDFGLLRAHRRLQHELDHQGVGGQIDEGDCTLSVEPEEVRHVRCAWQVEVSMPLRETPVRLAFTSSARIDRHGVLLH